MMGHRCKKRELSVLLIDEEDEDRAKYGASEAPTSPTNEIMTKVPLQPEVSLNYVIGLSNPKMMKLRGDD